MRGTLLTEGRERRLARMYRVAVAVNEAILRARSKEELFDRACGIAIDNGYDLANVRLIERDTLALVSVAYRYAREDARDAHKVPLSADVSKPGGQGLFGRACRSGQTQVANDYGAAARPGSAQENMARRFTPGSGVVFPLRCSGEVVGVFALHDAAKNAFDSEMVALLQRVADNISFSLDAFQREEQRQRSEKELAFERDLLRGLMENMPQHIFFKGRDMRYLRVNYLIARDLRLDDPAEAIGKRIGELLPSKRSEDIEADERLVMESGKPIIGKEEHFQIPGYREQWISKTLAPIRGAGGEVGAIVGIAHDITARKEAEARIQYLATHDGLTGLPNRTMFGQVLELAVKSGQRYSRSFAVMFIDLDRFKIINDTLGHAAGDVLLKEIAARFSGCLRAGDVLARLGGDEFVVLVQEVTDAAQAGVVARKILSEAIKPVTILGQECRVTASVGVCLYPDGGSDEQALMKNADSAMYVAKEEGKNNFQFYEPGRRSPSLERMTLEAHLRVALERGEFLLHYQPKVDMQGRITGMEALLRWRQPEMGLLQPLQFIALAEETGLIVPIGRWVMRTACAQNAAWQKQGLPPLCMAVNLSPRQFHDPELISDVAAALADTGLEPRWLELEITEGMVMHDIDRAARLLEAIKELGVKIALDDFGTGYSSLAQLKRFPIDTLKVDRSFIRALPNDAEDKAITAAILAMGQSLSLTIVAEGVETPEQESFLRAHACDQMQGYYFGKPVSPDEFAALLRRQAQQTVVHMAQPSRG
ncbi:MAG TPA: EAL domain-containing protein [Burkholderiales bacterium]|nr:EAL domain-containing protein [Burkholderiales bacterium]